MIGQATQVSVLEVQANRLDLVSRLADDLAHEIKNPLHAMVINLELLRRRVEADRGADALERVGILETEMRRVNALVEQLLRVIRPPRDEEAESDLAAALEEIVPLVEVLGKLARVDVEYTSPGLGPRVAMAKHALRHVVLNLVLNGLDAASGGGRVSVAVVVGSGVARVRVADDGPGIEASLRQRLGEPGVSSRPGRRGLGLAVACHLAAAAGGTVLLEEAPGLEGRGVAFTLSVPLAGRA